MSHKIYIFSKSTAGQAHSSIIMISDRRHELKAHTFVLAAGGTGGHFYPALSVAGHARDRGHRAVFVVGGQRTSDHLALADARGFEAYSVPAPRFGGSLWTAPLFPWRFGYAWWKARGLLKSVRPDAVLGMGSFAAAPACAAAVAMRIPLFLHEGNSILGSANRFFAPWSRKVAVSLPLSEHSVHPGNVIETGLPLRQQLLNAAADRQSAAEAKTAYGLAPDKPVLFIFGGSQGAEFLNNMVPRAIAELRGGARTFQVIHLTGNPDVVDNLVRAYTEQGITSQVRTREENMHACYAAADLALCRAGAATIAELALFGLPAILVPLPTAALNHQEANARMLAEANAATVLPQGPDAVKHCAQILFRWRENPQGRQTQARKIQRFSHPDATSRLVDLLESGKKNKDDNLCQPDSFVNTETGEDYGRRVRTTRRKRKRTDRESCLSCE